MTAFTSSNQYSVLPVFPRGLNFLGTLIPLQTKEAMQVVHGARAALQGSGNCQIISAFLVKRSCKCKLRIGVMSVAAVSPQHQDPAINESDGPSKCRCNTISVLIGFLKLHHLQVIIRRPVSSHHANFTLEANDPSIERFANGNIRKQHRCMSIEETI
ncbi:hypothetical protein BDZ85DRAFT_268846 [Elsinoe ampelina]|uniref:Uncharacterized protein n=1 Tax=Elsinoe ampelina TaxID=302913 RepID=A0A6A6G1N1_9PEZI|nr:hypothetical protein BDZ85DRAFT_268846 [Elsinoe ampelina]